MIQTRIINEINQSYLQIVDMDGSVSDDYRLKMLEENRLPCFLEKTVRCVDGIASDYYEVSGKESLISYFNLRSADRNELSKLLKAMADSAFEAEKLLIEEGNILFRPECIFIDSKTKNYEFICIPVADCGNTLSANLNSLMQFFLPRLDDNDIELMKTVYSLFDKSQSEGINCKYIYELFIDGISKNQKSDIVVPSLSGKDIEQEENKVELSTHYIPSVKGILAVAFAATGIFLIGYHTYLVMLSNV